jgi:predicted acylesterase/phospholipase RssA
MQGSLLRRAWSVFTQGAMYGIEHMDKHLEWFTQGMTFLEAYKKTGRMVNITCTPYKTNSVSGVPPMLCNHLTTPHVTLSSAAMASACVPKLIPPVQLQEKAPDGSIRPYMGGGQAEDNDQESLDVLLMRDGSFQSDVPVQELRSLFNANFHIVSQVNPHIIPFFFCPSGDIGRPIRWPWKRWRGGFMLTFLISWLKEDMIRTLRVFRVTDITFKVFGVDWSYLFLQDSQGDITIVPNASFWDYVRVMENIGSRAELERKMKMSERGAWRTFTMVGNRLRVENALQRLEYSLGGSPSRQAKK